MIHPVYPHAKIRTQALSALALSVIACGGSTAFRSESHSSTRSDTQAVAMGFGTQHTCALSRLGQVRCQGRNWAGQLGAGVVGLSRRNGESVDGVQDAIQVQVNPTAGVSCALVRQGRVLCWGSNEFGMLGVGHENDELCETSYRRIPCRRAPVLVDGLADVTRIAMGNQSICAVQSSGRVWCWGDAAGPLGHPNTPRPVLVPELEGVVYISASLNEMFVHVEGGRAFLFPEGIAVEVPEGMRISTSSWGAFCGVASNGVASCYGRSRHGLLGELDQSDQFRRVVLEVASVRSVAAGASHACLLKNDRSVWCWGDARNGALGSRPLATEVCRGFLDEDVPCVRQPVLVEGLTDVSSLALSDRFSCAVRVDGSIWCWGRLQEGVWWHQPRQMDW